MTMLMNFIIFYFGAILGSFLNVVILRLPDEHSLTGRSHCTKCTHTLSPWELIPLVSFLLLGGRCHSCGKKISPRYFVIEAVTGLLFLVGWIVVAPQTVLQGLIFLKWVLIASTAVVVFVIDLEHYIILDVIIFPILLIIFILSAGLDLASNSSLISWSSSLVASLLGAGVGALPFFLVWFFSKGEWMGFGDVKLMLLIGAVVGVHLVPLTILLAVFAGGAVSVVLLLLTKKTMKSQIPFGTFLVVSMLVVALWGPSLLQWYLGLVGF